MLRVGIWMVILGFGSLLLAKANMHFILLAWADDMQPGFGIGLGVLGALVSAAGVATKASKEQA